jgi:hypothetical protein
MRTTASRYALLVVFLDQDPPFEYRVFAEGKESAMKKFIFVAIVTACGLPASETSAATKLNTTLGDVNQQYGAGLGLHEPPAEVPSATTIVTMIKLIA